MPDAFKRPYLDSSVYLAAIKGEEGRADIAKRILTGAQNGEFQIIGSTLVIAEVVGAERKDRPIPEDKAQIIDAYMFHAHMQWVELSVQTAIDARRLARQHRLKCRDAIHLASAELAKADQLLRWDDDFRLREGEEYGSVVVCEPHLTGLPEELTGFDEA